MKVCFYVFVFIIYCGPIVAEEEKHTLPTPIYEPITTLIQQQMIRVDFAFYLRHKADIISILNSSVSLKKKMEQLLGHEQLDIQILSRQVLVQFPEIVGIMPFLLKHKNPIVRKNAAAALAYFPLESTQKQREELYNLVQNIYQEKSWRVQSQYLHALESYPASYFLGFTKEQNEVFIKMFFGFNRLSSALKIIKVFIENITLSDMTTDPENLKMQQLIYLWTNLEWRCANGNYAPYFLFLELKNEISKTFGKHLLWVRLFLFNYKHEAPLDFKFIWDINIWAQAINENPPDQKILSAYNCKYFYDTKIFDYLKDNIVYSLFTSVFKQINSNAIKEEDDKKCWKKVLENLSSLKKIELRDDILHSISHESDERERQQLLAVLAEMDRPLITTVDKEAETKAEAKAETKVATVAVAESVSPTLATNPLDLIAASSSPSTSAVPSLAPKCERVRLDEFGGSMRGIPVRRQLMGNCFVEAAVDLIDAYRRSHHLPHPEILSSPMVATIDVPKDYSKFELWRRRQYAKFRNRGSKTPRDLATELDGGLVGAVVASIKKNGLCPSELTKDPADEFSAAEHSCMWKDANRFYYKFFKKMQTEPKLPITSIQSVTAEFCREYPLTSGQLIHRIHSLEEDLTKVTNYIDFCSTLVSCTPEQRIPLHDLPDLKKILIADKNEFKGKVTELFTPRAEGAPLQPFSIGFCANILISTNFHLKKTKLKNFIKWSLRKCGRHAALVIGTDCDEKGKRRIIVKNSWGNNCDGMINPEIKCDKGILSIDEDMLGDFTFSIEHFP